MIEFTYRIYNKEGEVVRTYLGDELCDFISIYDFNRFYISCINYEQSAPPRYIVMLGIIRDELLERGLIDE